MKYIRPNLQSVISVSVLGIMTVTAINSDWSLGLLAVSYGPFFSDAHALSVLSVIAAALWLVYVRESMPMGVTLAIATVALHEFVWTWGELVTLGMNTNVSPSYAVYLTGFLSVAIWKGNRKEREMLVHICLLCLCYWIAFYVLGVGSFGRPFPNGVIDPMNGVLTIGGWILPCALWASVRKPKK